MPFTADFSDSSGEGFELSNRCRQITYIISSNDALLRSHTSSFLVSNLYESLIAAEARCFLEKLTVEEVMQLPVDVFKGNEASAKKSLPPFNACTLHPVEFSRPWVHHDFANHADVDSLKHNLIQMTEKKFHEVKQIGLFLRQNLFEKTTVIDLGSGKGYLSDMLQQHFGFNVIGIETCESFNNSAEKRNLKMARLWKKRTQMDKGYVLATGDEVGGRLPCDNSRTINKYEENKTRKRDRALEQELRDAFNSKLLENAYQIETAYVNSGYNLSNISGHTDHAIVGLHTCGDLAANSLRLFLSCQHSRFICNVGCCYNILSECPNSTNNQPGFPLSEFLMKGSLPTLGAIKSIACLSPEKTASKNAKNPLDKLFNRALLQLLVFEKTGVLLDEQRKVCKNKMGKSFVVFCRNVFPVLDLQSLSSMTDVEIEEFEKHHFHMKHKLLLFNQYRACFAPLLEALFLIDRLQFLRENGIKNCEIVQLFDPVISPRCFAIVASKDESIVFGWHVLSYMAID